MPCHGRSSQQHIWLMIRSNIVSETAPSPWCEWMESFMEFASSFERRSVRLRVMSPHAEVYCLFSQSLQIRIDLHTSATLLQLLQASHKHSTA